MNQRMAAPATAVSALPRVYDLATAAADYPDWEGPPRRTILICTHPRSGSTLLGEALHSAGGLGCPIEYFHRGFQPALEHRWGRTEFTDYVQAVYRHRTDPSGTLGVKLFWPDVEDLCARLLPAKHTALLESLAGPSAAEGHRQIHALLAALFPNPTFIHLVRQDSLRQAISAVVATQTGTWRSIPDQQNAPRQDPAYDFDRIRSALALGAHCERSWQGYFQANQIAPQRLTYEGLVDRFAATLHELFAALGRSDAGVRPPRMRRQADHRSEAMVLRFLRDMAAARTRSAAAAGPVPA